MKRFITVPVALLLALVLAVPVSADELYNPWTDLMDLTTVNGSGTNYFAFNKSTTINIDAGYESVVSYIDMVWFCGYGAPDSIYLWRNNSSSTRLPLTIKRLGTSNFYRVYGNVGGYTLRNLKFDITSNTAYSGTSSYRSYEIRSCRIAGSIATYNLSMSYSAFPEPDSQYSKNVWFDPVVDLEYGMPIPYTFEITPDDWALYDYLDIFISTQAATIDSVSVHHNGRAIPFTTSDHGTSYAGQTSQGTYDGVILPDSFMMLHVDLTTIQHSSNVTPTIIITGFINNGQPASIGWDSAIGYIRDAERGGVLHWFNQAKEFLTSLFSPSDPDAEDFGSSMESQAGDLQDAIDEMDQVTKPDVDDLDISLDEYMDDDGMAPVNGVLTAIFSNDIIVTMLIITLTCAFASYALFGKR